MILENICTRHTILSFIKNDLIQKGYRFKTLIWINGQLDLLDELIQKESFNVLNTLVREKTSYRLFKKIISGHKNLVSIYNNPDIWYLGKAQDNRNEYLNSKALIFSTESLTLIFSKNKLQEKYISNKWQ